MFRWDPREQIDLARDVARWSLIVTPMAVATGSAVALFLWALETATWLRWQVPGLLYLLPLAGVVIVMVYHHHGRGSDRGNNLIMDNIHEPGGGVPRRMAPLVLVGTVVTHLFGGSAGREGTAVQMGGAIASGYAQWARLGRRETRLLLMGGIAAGFGAVFGTPIAGAVFAMEVIALGRMRYDALVPCLMASLVGDITCHAWGAHHTAYSIDSGAAGAGAINGLLALKVALAAVAFGLAAVLFAKTCHGVGALLRHTVSVYWMRPVIGGVVVIALAWMLGTEDYLGLGVTTADGSGVSIVNAFAEGGAETWSWFWKLLFTAVTLGSGFKGGEVTPLFFVGATLGHTLALVLGVPVDLLAGIGFVAVFAGATNTPLACTIMGIELFGAEYAAYIAIGCFLAYLFSGHSGIYEAQRMGVPKGTLARHRGALGDRTAGTATPAGRQPERT